MQQPRLGLINHKHEPLLAVKQPSGRTTTVDDDDDDNDNDGDDDNINDDYNTDRAVDHL